MLDETNNELTPNNKITESDAVSHQEMIDVMSNFFDDGKPQVGIFWLDYVHNTLFGVQKDDAEKFMSRHLFI